VAIDIFQPSLYIAIFPYLFIGSFPFFGIVLVTKLMLKERKKKKVRNT
jgi:hypothetical protein